jgi:hypothetical protein
VLLCLLALALPAAATAVPSNGTTGDWTLIGGIPSVSAMERVGDVVYMAGWFKGFARRAPRVAALDAQSGELATVLTDREPSPSSVTAVAASPDGGAYIAGNFTGAAGLPQARLLRYAPDGTPDAGFRPQIDNGDVTDIEVAPNGIVYVAGTFTSAGGRQRFGLAAFNPNGSLAGWNPQATNAAGGPAPVSEIEIGAGGAYVAGGFQQIGSAGRPGLAEISLSTSAATAWNPSPNEAVRGIAVSGSTVYLAGLFTRLGSTARQFLAAVSTAGSGDVLAWTPSPNGPPAAIAVQGSTVYVGGQFSRIGSPAADRVGIAALDATSGQPLEWRLQLDNVNLVNSIVPAGDRVYVGFDNGVFPPAVGGAPRCGVAAVDPADAAVLGFDAQLTSTQFNAQGACGGGVTDLALAGGRIWAAGTFDAANVESRAGLAAFDVRRDAPLPWAPETNRPNQIDDSGVRDLALSQDGATMYLVGRFDNVNGEPRLNAAAVSATGAAGERSDVRPWDPAPNATVNALALSPSGQRVYLGGDFSRLSSPAVTRTRLAWVNITNGAPSGWRPSANQRVTDLAVSPDGSNVFVAGSFTSVGATVQAERRGLALLSADSGDASSWDAALLPGQAVSSAQLDSITLAGGLLYASGRFTTPGGQSSSVAAFDQTTGAATEWAPIGPGGPRVEQVSPAPDGSVYVLGSFSSIGGVPRVNAASFTAEGALTGWDPPGILPGFGNLTPSVQFVGDLVVVGGAFTSAGGRVQAGFAVFGPATAPGPGTPPTVGFSSLEVGRQLTCEPGSFTGSRPFTLRYEWLRDGQPIPGQADTTYTTTPDDANLDLSCRETAFNAAGSATQTSAPVRVVPLPPVLEVAPAVGGEPWVGGEASCSTGIWRNGPERYAFRWLMDGTPVEGATERGFRLTQSHFGRSLACEVTASNTAGSAVAQSAAVTVGVAPPLNLASPLLSGEARVGGVINCDPGSWTGASFLSYSWLRNGAVVPGASGTRLPLTSRELGLAVACRVTASGPGGTRSADSAAVVVQALPRQAGSRTVLPGESDRRRRRLDLRRARVQRDGSLLLKVAVPGAGSLSARATATVPRRSRARSAARVPFGRAAARPRRASTVTMRLKPGRKARRALRRAGRRGLKVGLVVRFRPRGGGGQETDRATVRVRPRPTTAFTGSSLLAFTGSSLLGY